MAVATSGSNSYLQRAPTSSGLADVLEVILDRGLVIDAFVRISVVGIELLTIDARIVVASVDTYLRFAEAVNRLDLTESKDPGLPELFGDRDRDDDAEHEDEDEGRGSGDGADAAEPSKLKGAAAGAAAAAVAAGAVGGCRRCRRGADRPARR
jgi:hypothetical protein